ncbi:D-amino acid dehydrogenase [Uliginosibacterium sp. H1]|uniref:D-amino acid dehydrogenase n=1 Tax=Uliginosibacterium sp. H1 TaxID=3114757 RepID=UPI002E174666|nr:D-amino acid dehydrogenase [Uliginosibacterium sp. H1]
MHIVVIGAGLAGVTAAWSLREAGHAVSVVERREAAGLETSFANGGQISVSHPEPWANPGAPLLLLRWLGRRDAPLLFRFPAEAARIRWGLSFLRECMPGRTRRNTRAIARMATYSARRLRDLRRTLDLHYDESSRGILHLYFSPAELRHGRQQQRLLEKHGIGARMLSVDECIGIEPSLAQLRGRLHGAMLGMEDESGDAYTFTQALTQKAAAAGVQFHFGCRADRLVLSGKRIGAVDITDAGGRTGALGGDAFVMAAGSYSGALVAPLGEKLPIYPVKGYSATLNLRRPERVPQTSLTDESRRIVCSRFGNQLRVAGTAELNGFDLSLDPVRCQALLDWTEDMFPGACDLSSPHFWAGLRPTTPSNLPLVGRSRIDNLLYNTGHGTLGWTLACGTAQALADIIDGRPPEPDFPFLRNGV